ncbi:hypothetical protein F4677DRAFT_414128 [Hypoxylon crocopeplum]|nr:hypothetical protein F4677DRAFT_414128 [Hypoxylon crocopeplum]
MEAIAAIGLASNVLQFIDVGYKVLSTSKELYGAGNEASRSNKDIEFISQEMKRSSRSLRKGISTPQPSDDEKSLLRLAAECERWSSDMIALLDRLKNKSTGSRSKALKAAWRNYKLRDERTRLEKGLDSCRKQLDLQLHIISRSETLEKLGNLDELSKLSNDHLTVLRRSVELLEQSLSGQVMSVSSQLIGELRGILNISDQKLLQSKQKLFLDALRFDGMYGRLDDVESAHAATFEWLLEGKHVPRNKDFEYAISSTDEFRNEARKDFTRWLRSGHGIFHISGKPGAGKSTLMKFLCKNQLATRYLEEWSGSKTLIFAKSFFWRLGSDTQRSLNGLVRSLFFQMLSAVPDLIPVAFPSLWAQADSNANSTIYLEADEIQDAFDKLLVDQATYEAHKIVFFIDGLNEYQGRHIDLVNRLFNWTSNTDGLKICVSSREWNEFMVGFAECPKLRIHECTYEDITTLITDRLKMLSQIPTLIDGDRISSLIWLIAYKAEGVFQWVRLVLTAAEDGILNGDDILGLISKIESFPNELGALYQYLFNSIHVADRRKAFEFLRMSCHMGLDRRLPLFQFWFLNQVIDDPTYALKMSIQNHTEEDMARLLQVTRRQLYGRCKGLLEVYSAPADLPYEIRVGLMHSTVHEFLDQSHIKEALDQAVGHVDFFDRICQTFLAHAKFANTKWSFGEIPGFSDTLFNRELSHIFEFAVNEARIFSSGTSTNQRQARFLEFLNELENLAPARVGSKLPNMYCASRHMLATGCFDILNDVPYPASGPTRPNTYIQTFAVSWLLHEFLCEKDPSYLTSIAGTVEPIVEDANDLVLLLVSCISHFTSDLKIVCYGRLCQFLELCFSRGISPNYVSPWLKGLSLFELTLLAVLFPGGQYQLRYNNTDLPDSIHIYPLRLLELCLRYGARSQFRICFGPMFRERHYDLVSVQVRPMFAAEEFNEAVKRQRPLSISKSSPVAALAEKRNWTPVTLRDLVQLWFPNDCGVLQHLIDRNNDGNISPDLRYPSPDRPLFSEEKTGRAWSEVELGDDILGIVHWAPRIFIADKEPINEDYEVMSDVWYL